MHNMYMKMKSDNELIQDVMYRQLVNNFVYNNKIISMDGKFLPVSIIRIITFINVAALMQCCMILYITKLKLDRKLCWD